MATKSGALAIDGNSLVYRAYYATLAQLPYFEQHQIPPNNAIKLMLIMVLKILRQLDPAYALVAFDGPTQTFRRAQYDAYKAGRKKTPDALIAQLGPLQEALGYCGLHTEVAAGVEADDLAGSFATLAATAKINCVVYSTDRDLLQLVDDYVCVYAPQRGVSQIQVYDKNNFAALMDGLKPEQIPDYKGIVGDSSDNLPGIKGIGHTTGVNLLKKYATLENIYLHLSDLPARIQTLFKQDANQAATCKQLATLRRDLCKHHGLDMYVRKPIDFTRLHAFLSKWKIRGMEQHLDTSQSLFADLSGAN